MYELLKAGATDYEVLEINPNLIRYIGHMEKCDMRWQEKPPEPPFVMFPYPTIMARIAPGGVLKSTPPMMF
jgi:hypothetical protein